MATRITQKNTGVKNKPVRKDQIGYGEFAVNWHESGPFVQVKDRDNNIIRVGGVIIQDEQPGLAQKGAFWLSLRKDCLFIYTGDYWHPICGGSDGDDSPAPAPPVVNDGLLTIQTSDGTVLGRFTANQAGDTVVTLPDPPQPVPPEWGEITNKPDCFPPCDHDHDFLEPNDGKLTIKDEDGDVLGEFTANQEGDTEVVIPAASTAGPPAWGEITDKPDCFEPCDHTHPTEPVKWDDIEGKPCIPECSDCLDCLEAECRYVGTKDPDELLEWLGENWNGYGYDDGCIWIPDNYSTPQDIFDIYIPYTDENPFCIEAWDHCFVDPTPVHYRLADGTEGTFQTETLKRVEFPDGRLHMRFIPAEKNLLPKDEAFEVWIDIDEAPDNITCHHPDHDDWVYWDNIVGVPEDLLDQELHLPSLPRVFDLLPTDLILISRKEYREYHDYAIEAKHAKNYFHDTVPDFDDGRPHLHIINGPTKITMGSSDTYGEDGYPIWTVDGDYLGKSLTIEPNQEVIIGLTEDAGRLFYYETKATFAIGPKTDTSKVRKFSGMFMKCSSWDGTGAEYLDVSGANSIVQLFYGCDVFNGDVSGYDVSNVQYMSSVFDGCGVFNQDISGWDVSNVEDFHDVFDGCKVFNQDLRGWNTMNATDMRWMFDNMGSDFYASDNSDLSEWCVPLITKRPSSSWSSMKAQPVWGTCPRHEDHPDWIDVE